MASEPTQGDFRDFPPATPASEFRHTRPSSLSDASPGKLTDCKLGKSPPFALGSDYGNPLDSTCHDAAKVWFTGTRCYLSHPRGGPSGIVTGIVTTDHHLRA